jgi:hypothetical protein
MDLTNMKKAELMKQCKEQGIKGYSKMKKEELIATLEESGITNTYVEVPKKEKKETVKKTAIPRLDKLSKKLEKFTTAETYKNKLTNFTEDVADEDLMDIITEGMKNFIISDTLDYTDYKKYVTTYGPIKALVEYNASTDSEDLSSYSEEQIFKILATYIYNKDAEIALTLNKKIRKLIVANNKVKKPSKKVTTYVESSEDDAASDNDDDDDEEESVANDVDDSADESEEEDD